MGDHDDERVPAQDQPAASAIPPRWRLIDELSAQPGPEAQAAALDVHRPAGTGRRHRAEGRSRGESPFAVDRRQRDRSRRRLERARGRSPRSGPSGPCTRRSSECLGDSDPQAWSAAVRLALEPKAKIAESALRKALDDPAPAARIALLERIAAEAELKNDLRLLGVVSNSLVDEHGGVCEKALAADPEPARARGQRGDRERSARARAVGEDRRPAARDRQGPAGDARSLQLGLPATRASGSTWLISRPRSCRSSTASARTARIAWAAIARTRS